MKEYKLINIYLTTCEVYHTTLAWEVQRLSNNFRPEFTDEEVITCYIFGITERKFTVKDVYHFISDYWAEWFPHLPTYKQFNKRITLLAPVFELYARILMMQLHNIKSPDYLTDSMPVVVAKASRSGVAKAANDLCDKGYCASKKMWFYGVKLHGLCQAYPHKMPKPHYFRVEPASRNDNPVGKEILQSAYNINVYGDKMFADAKWQEELASRNVILYTPVKLKKGQTFLDSADKLWSRAVSSFRQPIESFFAWFDEKTKIQQASKVRSANGLIAFVFARFAAVIFLLG